MWGISLWYVPHFMPFGEQRHGSFVILPFPIIKHQDKFVLVFYVAVKSCVYIYLKILYRHLCGKEIFANLHRKIYRILVNPIKMYLLLKRTMI